MTSIAQHYLLVPFAPMFRIVVVGVVLGACTRPNPAFCNEDGDCSNGEVCNLETNGCIPKPPDDTCEMDMECPIERPICGDDAMCRTCSLDDECASGVCQIDGTCEPVERVLQVRPNGASSGACTTEAPCSLEYARTLVDSDRTTLRLGDGTYSLGAPFVVDFTSLTIVGSRTAIIQRTTSGASFEIVGDATNATLRGFTLNRGLTCADAAVELNKLAFNTPGIDATSYVAGTACTLAIRESELLDSPSDAIAVSGGGLAITNIKIERTAGNGIAAVGGAIVTIVGATVTDSTQLGVTASGGALSVRRSSVSYNRLGGIRSTDGTFEIVNNFIFRNGDPGRSSFGGLHLDSAVATSRVQHNTVVLNDCDVNVTPALSGGVYCRIGPVNTIGTAYGNLIANNYRGNTTFQFAQTGGTCDFTHSLVSETTLNLGCVPGSDMCRLAGGSSPAIDTGPSLGVLDDFDGEPRSDGMPDMGADEFHP